MNQHGARRRAWALPALLPAAFAWAGCGGAAGEGDGETGVVTSFEALRAASSSSVIPEYQVSAAPIVDFEFDWGRDGRPCPGCNFGDGNNRLVFTDRDFNMWLAHVDHATGAFDPPDGQGVLLDTGGAFSTDFGNGPEWMFGEGGSQIVYTKYFPGRKESTFSASVAVAKMVDGAWQAGIVDGGLKKQSPSGTLDLDDPAPRINYQDFAKKKVYWRVADDPDSEKLMPIADQTGGGSRRWVPGTHMVIFSGSAPPADDGVVYQQVFTYNTDRDELKQLTFDPVTKWGAFMWRAPEFDDEFVFFTVYGRTSLAVYRRQTDGTWGISDMVDMPKNLPYAWSPEPFVYQGRSWIFLQISSSPAANDMSVPTQLAMTGIDPEHPNFRMLTNDSDVRRVRMDSEYYVTAQGPFIYYNRYVPSTDSRKVKNEGVWRVDTGLGAP